MSKMFTHPDGTEFTSAGELMDYVDTLKLRQRMAKEERDMPCFFCKAFGDDEQCHINRTSVNDKGVEGLDCPRIRKEIGEQEAAFAKMDKDEQIDPIGSYTASIPIQQSGDYKDSDERKGRYKDIYSYEQTSASQ